MNSMPDKAIQLIKVFWRTKDPFDVSNLKDDIDLSNDNIVGVPGVNPLVIRSSGTYYGQVKKELVDGYKPVVKPHGIGRLVNTKGDIVREGLFKDA